MFKPLALLLIAYVLTGCSERDGAVQNKDNQRPNFLFILSDDQSWQHTSYAGYPLVHTPNFDRVAREGVYFKNAYASAPTCTASRSSILSGQPIWRLGTAATLRGEYSEQMISFQEILNEAGYRVGSAGKGWGPGHVPRDRYAPTGPRFANILRSMPDGSKATDYPANFAQFLKEQPEGKPFSFWVGAVEPHRPYRTDAPDRFAEDDNQSFIPGTLPDTPLVRQELSAYLEKIEFFDLDVGRLLKTLETQGVLENTVVIITSDNGMPFSRGKPTNNQLGVRVPLAVRWSGMLDPGREVDDFVSLQDIAPTLLELAGVSIPEAMTGKSLNYALQSNKSGVINPQYDASFTAFERHAGFIRGGEDNLTYPRRAIHTEQYSYIRNYYKDRWPAGDPPRFVESYKRLLLDSEHNKPIQPYFSQATRKRPAEELYDTQQDPYQLTNLAEKPEHSNVKQMLATRLRNELINTADPLEALGQDRFQQNKYWQPGTPRKE